MKCFYTVFWSEVVILLSAGTFWSADGGSVTWYEPPPEETLSDHQFDHKLKTVQLREGETESPLSWNFSFSSGLRFNGLTVTFNGVNVAGVLSSGLAGLENPSDQRFNFSWIPTEKFTLVIVNVTDGESGIFTCALSLCPGFGCNNWESTIKVEVVEPASITDISRNQTVIVGKDVTTLNLSCTAVGNPKPNVTWIKVSDSRIVTFPLNISGEEDEGTYRCTADNGVGNSATRDVFITVLVLPELTFVSRDPVVCEDSTVTLSCNATGKPTPNITWTRVTVNGTTDSVPLHPVVDGTFLISNINRSSNGSTYRCTATNGLGDPVNRTVTVTVRYSAVVDRIVNSSNTVIEGEYFNMKCYTSGEPRPNVYWIKVSNGTRINGSILSFTNISRNDIDQYRCEAENDCGNNNSVRSIEVFFPPTEMPHPETRHAREGTQVTLPCPVDGRPEPNITWYKGNDTTGEVQHQGREWTFQAESNDAGWYSCSAKNFLNLFKPVNVSIQLIVEKKTTTASPTNRSQVDYSLQVTLPDTKFLPDYDNLSSAPAQELASKFEAEVDKLYENVANYGGTEVTKLSRGSVIVSFVMYFTTVVGEKEGLAELRDAVDTKKNIGNFTVEALKVIQVNPTTAASNDGSTGNPSNSSQKDGPPWPIIGGIIGAVVVVIIVILLVAWWVHNKRKCRRKDTKIHNSESEVLHGQNDIEDGAYARVNGGYGGRYADSGPPSANGTNKFVQQPQPQPEQQQQQQAAAAPPAHAVVDKSQKKKKKAEAEDPYAEVEDPKKDKKTADPSTHDYAVVNKSKKKKKEDENAYATVDKSKKSKKGQQKPKAPGEVLYADLGDFQPVQPLPTVSTSPEPLGPLKRATPYQGTEYADITQFLKGNATLPEGQSTEMQPTYANAGGGQEAANKENANKGGEGDIEPKETPM